ncbi:MAG: hypothetical protein AVDCRST_MAG48-1091 [uncultured Friedmanniella sp.]|uniref:Uncharacterized protein n=1 Tax=uncultured Friedmanniella sp. TaxID=335381 RepID=A0A6J4K853_9ACTN|nr:MAG: hypothetical protein AVDCRST_MAG48-1091 [uncultured Friedmanniella sp.]
MTPSPSTASMSMSMRSPGVSPGMPHIQRTLRSSRSVRTLIPNAPATSAMAAPSCSRR